MSSTPSRLVILAAASGLVLSLAACGSSIEVTLPSTATTTSTTTTTSTSETPSTSDSPSTSDTPSTSAASATPSTDDLLQQVAANFTSAKSAHLVAVNKKAGETQTLDISGTVDGANQRTVLTIAPDNVKAEIRTVDGRVYVNGNAAYYRKSGATSTRAAQIAGRWLSVPAAQAASNTQKFTLKTVFAGLKSNISSSEIAGLTVTASTRNGQQVWQASNPRTTIVVAADGSGRLMSASHQGLGTSQSYEFDQWDSAPTVDAPANAITT